MGYRGRKSRLKNFKQRAEAFYKAITHNESAGRSVRRSLRQIIIGRKKHKGLVLKRNPDHLEVARAVEGGLLIYYSWKKIVPNHYVLVPVHTKGRVQEYFNKPSAMMLKYYLQDPAMRESIKKFNPEDYFLCKQFSNQPQNKPINTETLKAAMEELQQHFEKSHTEVDHSNIIVLGRLKDGRIRLAIVDA